MTFELADGRRLGWAEYGDPAGAPIVFLHGTPGSRLFRPSSGLAGVRLITIDRPGYGESSPARQPMLLGVADAVGALTASFGIDSFGVVGFSGGTPYALACGVRLGRRVGAIAVAGMTGPDRELGTVHGRERLLAMALRHLPGVGAWYVRRAAADYAEDPVKHHRALLAAGNDPHLTADESSNWEAARQGSAGLVGDWLATDVHRWRFRLADVAQPVLIWAGRGDPGRAVPDAALMAARLPRATVVIAEDAGHTPSPWHWQHILDVVTRKSD